MVVIHDKNLLSNLSHSWSVLWCYIIYSLFIPVYLTASTRSKVLISTERLYMTLYMCFIETLVMTCTVSEILALIDHKSPNWTFLTLKVTFRVILHLSYFRTGLVSHKAYTWCKNVYGTSLLLNNINNYLKIGQTWPFWPWKWHFV